MKLVGRNYVNAGVKMHLSELLGRLHATHRKAAIDHQAKVAQSKVADRARRIVEKHWPQATPNERGEREREQRRRINRHFARQIPGADAWGFALTELTKLSPARLESYPLAEYVGLVNAAVPLDALPDHLKGVAALVAGLDATVTPLLLAKLRVQFPYVVADLGIEVPAVIGAGNAALDVQRPPSDLDFLTVKQAAAELKVNERTIRRMIAAGRLRATDAGTGKTKENNRIRRADLASIKPADLGAVDDESNASAAVVPITPPPRPRRRQGASSAAHFLPRV